jgi:hypothetical protein
VVVYDSPLTGERFEADFPLSSRFEVQALGADLGLPSYVSENGRIAHAIAILWAAQRATNLHEVDLGASSFKAPIPVLLFGGIGFRLLCPSANQDSPFRRPIGDVDIITTKSRGHDLLEMLTRLEDLLGSRFMHVVTSSDKMFNNLRAGQRYRVHAMEESDASEGVALAPLDILVDRIPFCHVVPVEEDAFSEAKRHLYTIGPARLLLTKLQYIRRMNRSAVPSEYEYRVIGEHRGELLLGPEEKDLVDIAALLYDRGVGEAPEQVDLGLLEQLAARDWGLSKTALLNAQNTVAVTHVLRARGATDDQIGDVLEQLQHVCETLDEGHNNARKPRFRFGDWWEYVED